jgi:hypothetical protein
VVRGRFEKKKKKNGIEENIEVEFDEIVLIIDNSRKKAFSVANRE